MRRRHIPGEPPPPTKGELKRAAQDAQALGEQLIAAPEGLVESLGLPEKLVDAILLARRITAHGGLARQRQYVGKLMRGLDLEPIRAALAAQESETRLDALRFKRAEHWRDRLAAGEAGALDEFLAACPGAERKPLERLVSEAAAERATGQPGGAGRRLFRHIRPLVDPGAGG